MNASFVIDQIFIRSTIKKQVFEVVEPSWFDFKLTKRRTNTAKALFYLILTNNRSFRIAFNKFIKSDGIKEITEAITNPARRYNIVELNPNFTVMEKALLAGPANKETGMVALNKMWEAFKKEVPVIYKESHQLFVFYECIAMTFINNPSIVKKAYGFINDLDHYLTSQMYANRILEHMSMTTGNNMIPIAVPAELATDPFFKARVTYDKNSITITITKQEENENENN